MLFNSFDFILYFPIVVFFYYTFRARYRWLVLLSASYIFYMWWEPMYIFLILFLTLWSYFSVFFVKYSKKRWEKKIFWLCLIVNLLPLFCFKYYEFFRKELFDALRIIGATYEVRPISILLPVGISFFTFQAISYVIDACKNKIEPERKFGHYALFVSFFPQLVAGPIERASSLLPQLKSDIHFKGSRITKGLQLILWGMLIKVVIADRVGIYVDQVYNNYSSFQGLPLLLATYLFSYQIYCDFLGYSTIAVGTAQVLGVSLITNFNFPYLASSMSDFWSRWHISLTTWFRDYLYIPLGGNRASAPMWCFNILIVFMVSGLWHGANWTFVVCGSIHGFLLLLERLGKYLFRSPFKIQFSMRQLILKSINIFICFQLVAFAWIFFRSATLSQALTIVYKVFTGISFKQQQWLLAGIPLEQFLITLTLLSIFITIEILVCYNLIPSFNNWRRSYRWSTYYIGIIVLLLFGEYSGRQFIYYQF